MALDSAGFPHIIYRIEGEIRHAFQDTNGWEYETVADGSGIVEIAFELDFKDIPRIGYIYSYEGKYGSGSGVIYDGEVICNGSCYGLLLALADDGSPHLFYYGTDLINTISGFMHAYKDQDDSWSFENIENIEDAGLCQSLSLDEYQNPHFSCFDIYSADLNYAYISQPYLLTLSPAKDYTIDFPGSNTVNSLNVHNRGTEPDSYSISTSGFDWPTTAPTSVGSLAGGESTTIDIQVQIPVTATMGMSDTATITVTSQADSSRPSVAELITLVGKATFLPLVER